MARHFWSVGEAVSGAMYLFTGAIFPLDVLPVWLRWIGFLFPVTYWLEAARRALLGSGRAGLRNLRRHLQCRTARHPGRIYRRAAGQLDLLLPLGAGKLQGTGAAGYGVGVLGA